jgi:hypothetical protein
LRADVTEIGRDLKHGEAALRLNAIGNALIGLLKQLSTSSRIRLRITALHHTDRLSAEKADVP